MTRRKRPSDNTPAVRIVALGGLGEIGKNCTVIEQGDDLIVIDCGIAFPREEGMFGADIVVNDFSYLQERASSVRALIVTHGHEDHIGGIPYLLRDLEVPEVWGTRFTLGLIKSKVDEFGLIGAAQWREIVPENDSIHIGPFELEFVRVSHSIPDAVAVAVHTSEGTILHTGDIKLDSTPLDGIQTDLVHLAEIGGDGVALYLADSTNADVPGHTRSERSVHRALRDICAQADSRIVACCFSSHIHRIQQMADIAQSLGRSVCILGRSMTRNTNIARNLGYMDLDGLHLVKPNQIDDIEPHKLMVLCTGSQGEPLAAMSRFAFGSHPTLEPSPHDTIIFSSSTIPGNEIRVHRVINQLSRVGASIFHSGMADVHVSGHASAEELKTLLQLVRPTCFMPVHGEWRHMRAHAALARMVGVDPERITIGENGTVIELRDGMAAASGEVVHVGQRMVDRHSKEDILNEVMEDRQQVGGDGLLVVVAHRVSGELEVIARGFQGDEEADGVLAEARDAAEASLRGDTADGFGEGDMHEHVRDAVASVVYDRTRRSPLVVPVLLGD
jgi:ribonuclease J